ncbi:dual specificity protein phosphatase family protein [Spiroplasma turonicum]|uniref:Tyrosine specific protein phosphatases domain-containing protein n=1 Tax=Spiroplasma turonicum TaxID=216946 RepID=A0A0K1P793_9MOLU|nr:dual specificity protein phosphatase family protein [Spiroplasma turonicum]AKU79762.1 hypothetical protein STURON_00516 [Spiroplasma turonicum]ALX70780.1 hypothetical protein STURO_v1c05140 [Spiroplasma turonicum]
MSKKIIENLYLGDMNSTVYNADLVISCAEETFDEKMLSKNINVINENKIKMKDKNKYYYRFEDYPYVDSLDINLIKDVFNLIDNNIENKVIYIHCIWGVNRSASIVFMYLVNKGFLTNSDYNKARRDFLSIYPKHSPNPGWKEFLEKNYPYNFK